MQGFVTTITGLLEAAERRGHVAAVPVIDPDTAGSQFLGDTMAAAEIGGPDAGSQTEIGVVGDADGFFLIIEGDDRQYRAENF